MYQFHTSIPSKVLRVFIPTIPLLKRIAVISPTRDFANVMFANVFGRFADAMSCFANILLVTSPMPNI